MLAAFPNLYADSFSGFYLVLTVVLWMLIARGTAIEFRSRVADPLWRSFWDFVFSIASIVLALFFGAAFANVFRGVPIDANGEFSGTFAYALNPYALNVGFLSVFLLAMHGAAYAAIRLDQSALRDRALEFCKWLLVAIVPLTVSAAIVGLFQRPDVLLNFTRMPTLIVVPLLGLVGFVFIIVSVTRRDAFGIVKGTSLTIVGLMGSAGVSLYPHLLPAINSSSGGLTIYNAAVSQRSLTTALFADLFAITLVIVFTIFEHRVFKGKIAVSELEVGH
jgi:cytochrome d ubiquinol oxidase subunit II